VKILILLSALALSACGDSSLCDDSSDCFSIGVCVSGRCEPPTQGTNNVQSIDNNTTGTTNGATNSTTGVTNNVSNMAVNNTAESVCVVDPSAACSDPSENMSRNDSQANAHPFETIFACRGSDIVTPETVPFSGQLCAQEPGDWYAQTVRSCRNLTVVASVTVTPEIPCKDSDWELGVTRGDTKVSCSAPDVQCSQQGGSKTVKWLIPTGEKMESIFYSVEAAGPTQFAYTGTFAIK